MLTSARIVLKHHRFEVGAAVILGLFAAVAALVISYRLNAIGVPAGCFERWLAGGGAEGAGDCAGPVQAFADVNEDQAGKLLAFMAVLPFIVGLLAGVSIVGRELEARTAQTAWALTPSRRRWLARQVGPILLIVTVVVALAAGAATVLETTREPWYHSTYGDLMLHGWPVVGRALAAFSVGLLVGAIVGRSLPALIVAALVCVVLLMFDGMAQNAWYQANFEVIADTATVNNGSFDGIYGDYGWLAPDGRFVGEEAAFLQVPTGTPDAGQWLLDNEWKTAVLGVPSSKAGQLATLDALGFAVLALIVGLATVPVVDRRRPV
jgi:hypothetical protein